MFISRVASRVQMGSLSSFLTTSFHTRLSFMDAYSDDNMLEDEDDVDDEDEDDDEEEESYATAGNGFYLNGHNNTCSH